MSQAPYNCVADGAMDCSPAFDAAIELLRNRRFVYGRLGETNYGGSVPGGQGTIYWPSKAGPDGNVRPYRLSRAHKVYGRMRILGDGPDSCLMFDAGVSGLILDSLYTQSQADLEIKHLSIEGRALRPANWSGDYLAYYAQHGRPPGVGDVGIHLQGGVQCVLEDLEVGGFDRCLVLDGAELISARDVVFSTWNDGAFTKGRVGVHFAARPQGGGVTNRNSIADCQFQTLICIQHDDGAANVIERCNFNAPFEMLRVLGAQGLTVRDCTAEGCSGDTLIRCGPPGGTTGGVIGWQQLRVEGCVFTLGGAQQPALLKTELGYQGQTTSFAGTRVIGGRVDENGRELGAIAAGMGGPDPYVYLSGAWTPPSHYEGGALNVVAGAWYILRDPATDLPIPNPATGGPIQLQRGGGLWAHRPYWGAVEGIVPPYAGQQ